ncbi:hypothetical protein [Pseudooceanicola sp. HF7]|uniref:hypothetical protein n=1 Tax=Pseudooceanicola sp. HF7 TaxID=2721560 RepID=UPI00143169C4|nr:hypothetical protein [Pseudooceanicola sp. HF7]NIZ10622.1 hypothetical protein [Pseudooceanicola sp. HF7]
MQISWFATFNDKTAPTAEVTPEEIERITDIVKSTPGLSNGLVSTPWDVPGMPFDDKPLPQLALQLYFDDIEQLEAALEPDGHLQKLADKSNLPTFKDPHVTEEAMLTRVYHAPDPAFKTADGKPHCSFLVQYPGPSEQRNKWIRHYVVHHTAIMKTFPGIRQIEVCTALDWCSSMPWERVGHMLRNKVVFDDDVALQAALGSPVLDDMMADAALLPPYDGGSKHFPMATWGAPNR